MKDSFLQGNGSLPFTLLFYIHTNQLIMFIQPSNLQSTSIEDISVNMNTNQVMVKYINNDKTYLYDGVHFNYLIAFVLGKVESIGQWVNTYVKGNQVTVIA